MRPSFIPVPIFLIAIAVFYLFPVTASPFEPRWLLPILNLIFIFGMYFIAAYVAARGYMASGSFSLLMLSCGVFEYGLSSLVAGWLESGGPNSVVTMHNLGVLAASIFHLTGTVVLFMPFLPEPGIRRKKFWLIFSYSGLLLFTLLLSLAVVQGWIVPFFIPGVGPTPVRQVILGVALAAFAFSFLLLMRLYIGNRKVFLYWYSLALGLIAVGILAILAQRVLGRPINWTGRIAQYIAGVYFVVATLKAIREAKSKGVLFSGLIAASFHPAERKFRALAENSPDVIDRFDREMRHVYINPAGLLVHGKSVEAIIGKTIRGTGVPEPYCSVWEERIRRVFETGQSEEMEDSFPTANGLRYYSSRLVPEFTPDRRVEFVLVVSREITERKQAEEALRKAKDELELRVQERTKELAQSHRHLQQERQRLYDVLETLPAMVCLLMPDYHVAFANRSFREKFGESGGRHCYEYCFGSTGPCDFCESYKVLETGQPHHWEVTAPDGSVIDAYDFPFTDADGSPLILKMDIDITECRQTEAALRERTAELTKSRQRLQQLTSHLLLAQEKERKRVSVELHDGLLSELAAMKFLLEAKMPLLEEGKPLSPGELKRVLDLLATVIKEARRIMTNLHPPALEELGLLKALDWLCGEYRSSYPHIAVQKQIEVIEQDIPDGLKVVIFRVLQEALNNFASHGKGDRVNLSLSKSAGIFAVAARDNGRGFDVEKTSRGLGLESMKERVELSGGEFQIESVIGQGTIIRAIWPLLKITA